MKPNNQRVYIPVKEGDSEMAVSYWEKDTHVTDVKEQEGYFFTPEQLNEYTQHVINQTLKTVVEKVELGYECGNKTKEGCLTVSCYKCTEQVNKYSILDTFKETFNKFKV